MSNRERESIIERLLKIKVLAEQERFCLRKVIGDF